LAAPTYGEVFQSLYDGAVNALSAGAGALIADGQDLAGMLLFITLAWGVVTWMLTGDGVSTLVDGIQAVLKWSIVSLLLLGWLATVGGFFQGAANDIGGRLASLGATGAATPGERVADTVNTIMIGAGRLLSSERAAPSKNCTASEVTPSTPEESSGATAEDCVTSAGQNAELTWVDMLKYFPVILFTWLLRLIALFFMGMMVVAYLFVMILAEVLFGVGMCVGPILIPWLIWQRTEWLFDGWLRFMVSATLTKIVAGLMTSLMTGVILAVKTVSEMVEVKDPAALVAVDEFTALMLCVVAALGALLMWQVPGIAQGLVSGAPGVALKGIGRGISGESLRNSPRGAMGMANATVDNVSKVLAHARGRGK